MSRNWKEIAMRLPLCVLVLSSVLTAGAASSDAVRDKTPDFDEYQRIELGRELSRAEKGLNSSPAQYASLVAAVDDKRVADVKTWLVYFGVSDLALRGLELRLQDVRAQKTPNHLGSCSLSVSQLRTHIYLDVVIR
jgi:hypothetical protein